MHSLLTMWLRVAGTPGAALFALLLLVGCSGDAATPLEPMSLAPAIGADSSTGATVETDEDDYLPGDTVRIEGRGWAQGELVTLRLTREPLTSPDNEWQVTAGADGGFDTSFPVVWTDLGVTFTLTATGPVSGSVVTVAFTDGNLQQVTLSPESQVVNAGSQVAFTANVIMGGSSGPCNITVSVLALPQGITSAPIPSPNPTVVSPGNINFTKTITFNTSASLPNGSYMVFVRAAEGGNCNSPGGSAIGGATIRVGSSNAAPVLASIGNRTVNEESALEFTAGATDESVSSLVYSLEPAASGTFPAGAVISGSGGFSWTPSEAQGPGVYRAKVKVTDNGGLSDDEEFEIQVLEVNRAPELTEIAAQSVDEGSELSFTATATDPDLPANGLTFSLVNAPAGASMTPEGVFSWTPANGPASASVTVKVTDNGSPALSDEQVVTITVNNVAPSITAIGVPGGAILAGTPVSVTWSFTDPGTETWSCEISWDIGEAFVAASYAAPKSCVATRALPAGIYTVTVKVSDDAASDVKTATTSIIVFDPEAGFVTGGGWIQSPAGSLTASPASSGKATFGFSVKYLAGRLEPQGNLTVQLHQPGLMLKATSFQWLVVSGPLAVFRGQGTLQGMPGVYGFMVTALRDGSGQIRICVWNQATGAIVYDTHPSEQLDSRAGTPVNGGSITIHGGR